jgi:hypothetical protein
MSNLQTRIQTLSIEEDCEIHWTIIADVPYMDFTTAAGAFLMGRTTRAALDVREALKHLIVKVLYRGGHPLPMVPIQNYAEAAPKYMTTNLGKQRWEAFLTAIKSANISGVAPQSAQVPPIVGIDAATAEPIFGNSNHKPSSTTSRNPASSYVCADTQELLNSVDIRSIPPSERIVMVLALTAQNRQAAAIAEMENNESKMQVLEKMEELANNPRAVEFVDNLSRSRLEHVSFAEMRSSVSSSAVVHPVSRPDNRPPMRRTIGNETFVNAPSMMQQGEIVSNPDGTGIRNGRVQQPSNAPAPMKIDEVEDEDDEGDGTDIDADMVEMADGPAANNMPQKNSQALSFLEGQLKSWQKQVRADPNGRRSKHPYVVVNNSKVTLQELKSIEGFQLVIYKSKNFPYGKIKQRREDSIDPNKPLKMYLAAKPISRDGKLSYKITCLMRN